MVDGFSLQIDKKIIYLIIMHILIIFFISLIKMFSHEKNQNIFIYLDDICSVFFL